MLMFRRNHGPVESRGDVSLIGGFAVTRVMLSMVALVGAVLVASVVFFASGSGASAATTRVLVDGENFPDGFTVPAGEVWEFDPNADVKVTTSGNVIVLGTLRMRPSNGSVEHFLQFTGIDESKFVGGGLSHTDAPNDIGLWVEDTGVLDISGTPVTPWSYKWESDWSAADDIVAVPNKPGDYTTFKKVNSAAAVPAANKLGYKPELLNLTRNVRIEGTKNGKTHIFINAPNAPVLQTIEYLAIRYVAPWISDETSATGRYGLHFHRNGKATAGTQVTGVVVRDADNHSFVPHASDGITFTDTIAYSVTGEAYWWDRSTGAVCGTDKSCNETNDVVYDSVVAADILPPPIGEITATVIWMGGGENLTVTNSVVVGMQGGWGKNASAIGWPNPEKGVWNWTNNIAHNNRASGIFVWQNTAGEDDENHVIDGFTAYYNAKAGVNHGAYRNAFVYKNLTLLENGAEANGDAKDAAIQSHAVGRPSSTTNGPGATDTQEWSGIDTGGSKLVVRFHALPALTPVRFLFCDFSEVVFSEGPNGNPGAYDFIECGLDFDQFDTDDIHPGTVIRVQDGDSAYKFVGTGAKQTIGTFYGDPQPPPPPPDPGVSGFLDISGSIFKLDIEWLAAEGITKGCNPPVNNKFCPDGKVTRGQMAAFLNRALDLPAGSGNPFIDDNGSIFENDIEALAASGITKGCNPPVNDKFCPDAPVTRGQMAAFLNRALDLPAGSGNPFIDDNGSIFENDIEALAASGITKGCNPPVNDEFCPGSSVTRGQMAAFLHRSDPYLP